MPVETDRKVEEFFFGAKKQYNDRGIVGTRAEIQGIENLNGKIVLVTARFPWLDASGKEKGGETSTYTLRRDNDGKLRIRSSICRARKRATSRACRAGCGGYPRLAPPGRRESRSRSSGDSRWARGRCGR